VALFLGWALADEQLTLQNIAAAAVILTSVVIITASQTQDKTKEKQVTATDATI
jgi:drug/metabolite transporter (DMT)-like permease